MHEDIEDVDVEEEDDYDNEWFKQTSVYEQFGYLKSLHNDNEDLREVLFSAIYFVKNGYVADIDEVYKKFYPKNRLLQSLSAVGGSVNTSNSPFSIPSPAPYITSILGISNPFDCN